MDEFNNEREELRKVQAIFEQAAANNTIEDIRPFTDPQFSFVSFTDRAFDNFDSFCKQWKITRDAMVGSGKYAIQLNPTPSLFFDDIAVCQGNAENHLVNNQGKEFDFTSNWTVVFKRANDGWKVLRAHNSLNPFTNPMLVHAVKAKLVKYSLAAFIVGGVVCSVLTYLILHSN
ncbi:MAG: hypothetical protein PVG20_01155 [Thioalkalispiraceae bacterium]